MSSILDSPAFWRLLSLATFAIVWQTYAVAVGGILIPTLDGTIGELARLILDPTLWNAAWISNQSLFLGFAIAVALGIPLGMLLGRFPLAKKFADVYINILLVTPMAMVIPLLLMSVGIGLESRVLMIVLFVIPELVVNSEAGVRQVDPSLIEMAKSFGAKERAIWWRILLPASLPSVLTGVRLGLARAVAAMVIIELLMVAVGLGGLILEYQSRFQAEELYAVVILIVAEAFALVALVRWFQRELVPWAKDSSYVNY